MNLAEPHVLVTGGLGLIGSHVAERLCRRGIQTTVIDNLWNNGATLGPVEHAELDRRRARLLRSDAPAHRPAVIHELDLCDATSLQRLIAEHPPTHVAHLAGLSRADLAYSNSSLVLGPNLLATHQLLESLSRQTSVQRVLFTSSSMVYGHFEEPAATETHPCRPIEPYGTSKLACEALVQGWGRRFGVETVIIRPSSVYGAHDLNHRVPQAFLSAALAGRPMTLHQRGEQRLDFTYVDDVAAGIELALFAPAAAGEIFNVTYGEARSVAELADIIRHYLPTARIEHRDEDVRRPRRGTLDIAKARRLLGYAPGIPLEEGIRRLLLAHGCPVPKEPAARAASLSAPL